MPLTLGRQLKEVRREGTFGVAGAKGVVMSLRNPALHAGMMQKMVRPFQQTSMQLENLVKPSKHLGYPQCGTPPIQFRFLFNHHKRRPNIIRLPSG